MNFRIYKKNYVCNLRNSVNQWMTKDEIIYFFFISVSFFSALFIDVCSVCMLGHVYFCACIFLCMHVAVVHFFCSNPLRASLTLTSFLQFAETDER